MRMLYVVKMLCRFSPVSPPPFQPPFRVRFIFFVSVIFQCHLSVSFISVNVIYHYRVFFNRLVIFKPFVLSRIAIKACSCFGNGNASAISCSFVVTFGLLFWRSSAFSAVQSVHFTAFVVLLKVNIKSSLNELKTHQKHFIIFKVWDFAPYFVPEHPPQ